MKADGLDPLPTYTPPREDPQTRPDLAGAVPAPAPQPAAAAVPQLDLRQLAHAPRRGRRPDRRAVRRGRRAARPGRRRVGRGLQRPRPVPGPGRPDRAPSGRAWPSPPASTGTSSAPAARNVNSTTSSALTDMGGGATFFDNLVEVRSGGQRTADSAGRGTARRRILRAARRRRTAQAAISRPAPIEMQDDPDPQPRRVDPQLEPARAVGPRGERHHRLGAPAPLEQPRRPFTSHHEPGFWLMKTSWPGLDPEDQPVRAPVDRPDPPSAVHDSPRYPGSPRAFRSVGASRR